MKNGNADDNGVCPGIKRRIDAQKPDTRASGTTTAHLPARRRRLEVAKEAAIGAMTEVELGKLAERRHRA